MYQGTGKKLKIPPHHHRVGHFYSRQSMNEETEIENRHLTVLEEGNMRGIKLDRCNAFEDFPVLNAIRLHLKEMGFAVGAAAYHESYDLFSAIATAFFGHRDKKMFGDSPITFVPLEGTCTVFVACPGSRELEFQSTERVRSRLLREGFATTSDAVLAEFETAFFKNSGLEDRSDVRMFTLEPGDFLSFNATELYHAVIIHPHTSGRRRLIAFHALDSTVRTVD